MKSRIERSLLNLQNRTRNLVDAFRNSPSVIGPRNQGPENQEIESALRKVEW